MNLQEIVLDNINNFDYEEFPSHNRNLLSTTLAAFVADEDVFDRIYLGISVDPVGINVCNSSYCRHIGQSYKVENHRKNGELVSRVYCKSHAGQAMYSHIHKRIDSEFHWAAEDREWLSDLQERIDLFDGYLTDTLTNWKNWEEMPVDNETCVVCTQVIVTDEELDALARNATFSIDGARTISALDANGVSYQVHDRCASACQNCHVEYLDRSRGYTNNEIPRMHMPYVITHNISRSYGHWCQTCVDSYVNNEEYKVEECDSCSSIVIGIANSEPCVWSELHGMDVCRPCYDAGVDCDECGYTMYNNEYHDCSDYDDGNNEDDNGIHNYSYKPRPIFYGISPFMGFELEVECEGGSRSDGVDIFQTIDPKEKHYYLKSDGSLNYGFEIVSHPHDLDTYHSMDWSWLDTLANSSFRSWNTSSCGLHVHIGLDAFKDDNHQIRFTKFIYDNERQSKRIAGRSSGYAAFDDKGKVIPKIKYKHRDTNRYSAVNVQNSETLEVRIFRGSLRKERVLSGIEFTHAVCEYTRNMKIVPKNKPFSWLRFVAFVSANDDKYPNLFTIINETFERRSEIDQEQDGNN